MTSDKSQSLLQGSSLHDAFLLKTICRQHPSQRPSPWTKLVFTLLRWAFTTANNLVWPHSPDSQLPGFLSSTGERFFQIPEATSFPVLNLATSNNAPHPNQFHCLHTCSCKTPLSLISAPFSPHHIQPHASCSPCSDHKSCRTWSQLTSSTGLQTPLTSRPVLLDSILGDCQEPLVHSSNVSLGRRCGASWKANIPESYDCMPS